MTLRSPFHVPWWYGFNLTLILPVSTFLFLATGPHGIDSALAWTLPVWLLIAADRFSPAERRRIPASAPRWFFDGLLYTLVALQIINVIALGTMVSQLHWSWTATPEMATSLVNLLAIRILGGTNACCAVMPPAHELIHRRSRWQRRLGRLLLVTNFYDHFYAAHKLGHHAQLGLQEDPSTARPAETYGVFLRRSLLSQWRIAWRYQPRRVMLGLAVEVALLLSFWVMFGTLAACMLLYQAWVAIRLLEAVNYFQHFGLTVESGRPLATAWRSESAVSLFIFLGLTRHADHHRRPSKTYPELVDVADCPTLPYGYLITAIWVKNASDRYRRWALSGAAGESGP